MNIILPWHFVITFWQPQWPDPERCIKLPQSLSTLQYSSPAENNLFKLIWVFASSTTEAAVCLVSLPVWLSGLLSYWDWKSCDLWLPGLLLPSCGICVATTTWVTGLWPRLPWDAAKVLPEVGVEDLTDKNLSQMFPVKPHNMFGFAWVCGELHLFRQSHQQG